MAQETGGTGLGHRSVSMTRVSKGVFDVTNVRGGTMRIGGDGPDFTPVELLLADPRQRAKHDIGRDVVIRGPEQRFEPAWNIDLFAAQARDQSFDRVDCPITILVQPRFRKLEEVHVALGHAKSLGRLQRLGSAHGGELRAIHQLRVRSAPVRHEDEVNRRAASPLPENRPACAERLVVVVR